MTETRRTTTAEARHVGDAIGVHWSRFGERVWAEKQP